jgi:hypothetical protein
MNHAEIDWPDGAEGGRLIEKSHVLEMLGKL